MTTKQKATRILIIVGFAWLIWIAPQVPYLSQPKVEEVYSPSRVGSAILYTDQGSQINSYTVVFIRDYVKSGSRPLNLTSTSSYLPLDAVWSKDGNLLAVSSGSGTDKVWVLIYDFSKHRRIYYGNGNKRFELQNSKILNGLLNKHGGRGLSFTGRSRFVRWWEDFDVNGFSTHVDN